MFDNAEQRRVTWEARRGRDGVPVPEAVGTHRGQLGRTLRALRQERGLSLRGLASQLAVSPATLSAVENGRTGLSTARALQLAAALDVPVARLFEPPAPSVASAPSAAALPSGPPSGPATAWRVYPPLALDPALAGALAAFLEFGYSGASMRTIADRAGLSVPGLYHYYASKQDMLRTLLELTMRDLLARSTAARAEGADVVERFRLLVECLALFHTHRRELGFVGASEMRSLHPAAHDEVAARRREQQRMVDDEVAAGVAEGLFRTPQPREASRAVVTMCTALPQWYRREGPAAAERIAELYVGFALDVVRWSG